MRSLGLAFAVAMIFQSGQAISAESLTDADQDQIDLTVFNYILSHQTYFSENARDFDFYISLRGHDPTTEFLKAITVQPEKFKPVSTAPGAPMDGMLNRAMRVGIGTFTEISPDVAQGGINAYCGGTCGSQNTVTVHKVDGKWEVATFQMNLIY
jgi:hypothetical protein